MQHEAEQQPTRSRRTSHYCECRVSLRRHPPADRARLLADKPSGDLVPDVLKSTATLGEQEIARMRAEHDLLAQEIEMLQRGEDHFCGVGYAVMSCAGVDQCFSQPPGSQAKTPEPALFVE